jgi:hypothetical protein
MNTPRSLRNELKHDLDVLSGFWLHLLIYFLVMTMIWFGWVVAGGEFTVDAWPIFPSIGWGLGVIIHCLITYRTFRKEKRGHQRS